MNEIAGVSHFQPKLADTAGGERGTVSHVRDVDEKFPQQRQPRFHGAETFLLEISFSSRSHGHEKRMKRGYDDDGDGR